MSKTAKILLALNGLLVSLALNPGVQGAIASFISHHPFLSTLGVTLSSVAHLLTDSRKSGQIEPS